MRKACPLLWTSTKVCCSGYLVTSQRDNASPRVSVNSPQPGFVFAPIQTYGRSKQGDFAGRCKQSAKYGSVLVLFQIFRGLNDDVRLLTRLLDKKKT